MRVSKYFTEFTKQTADSRSVATAARNQFYFWHYYAVGEPWPGANLM